MKIAVKRELNAGAYFVSFDVTDVTQEDRMLFAKFGTPQIAVLTAGQFGQMRANVPLTQIGDKSLYRVAFNNAAQANQYADQVVADVTGKMARIRDSRDDFTSVKEVDI